MKKVFAIFLLATVCLSFFTTAHFHDRPPPPEQEEHHHHKRHHHRRHHGSHHHRPHHHKPHHHRHHPNPHHRPHMESQELGATVVDVAQAIVGIMDGIGVQAHLDDVTSCIQDTETIWEHFHNALVDFGQETFSSVKSGVMELGRAAYEIPTDVQTCESIPSDVAKLKDMAKIFLNPIKLIYNVADSLWVNGVDIFTELHTAVNDYEEAKYYDFGKQIGQAFATVFFNGDQAMNEKSIQKVGEVEEYEATPVEKIEDIGKFIGGFLVGVAIESEMKDVTDCLQDGERVYQDLATAVDDFKQETFNGVKAGLSELGVIIKEVPAMLSTCKSIPSDIERLQNMALVFTHPLSLIYHVGKNLIVNGVEIFEDITQSAVGYDENDFYKCGKYAGEALVAVFLKSSQQQKHQELINSGANANVAEVILGFFEGVSMEESLDNLEECLIDGDEEWQYIYQAYVDCNAGTFTGAYHCMKDMGNAVKLMPTVVSQCKGAPADIKKLQEMAKVFTNPVELVYNVGKALIFHGIDIYDEISYSITSFSTGDYNMFGFNMGKAMAEVFFGYKANMAEVEDAKEIAKDVGLFTLGFLEGVLIEAKMDDIETCINDSVDIFEDVKEAIEDFEKQTFSGIADGLRKLADAVQVLPEDVKACKGVPAEIDRLISMAKIFLNKFDLIYHIAKSILVNGVEIYHQISSGVSSFKSGDYQNSGKYFGEAFELVFLDAEKKKQQQELEDDNLDEVVIDGVELVAGVLEGISITQHLSYLETCIQEPQTFVSQVEAAIGECEDLTYSSIKKCLQDLGSAGKMIPDILKNCKDVPSDISKIQQMSEIFEHPATLVYHVSKELLLNGVEIIGKINTAVTDIKGKQYYNGGIAIGEAFSEVFYDEASKYRTKDPKNEAIVDFLKGLFSVTFQKQELGDSEIVSEWIYNLTFDREDLFDELYMASYVINHYTKSSQDAYKSVGNKFSVQLAKLMSEIEVVDALGTAANMLKNVMTYHAGSTELHSALGEMIVMKMAEVFEAQEYWKAGMLYGALLHEHMESHTSE